MGWSCTTEAGRTLDTISKECARLSGMSNVFYSYSGPSGVTKLFWERGREQADGSITGGVFDYGTGVRRGSFKIDADGNVVMGSAAFQKLAR